MADPALVQPEGYSDEPLEPRPKFSPSQEFYEYVARGYDMMVETYDYVEGRNILSERVRQASLRAALTSFNPGHRILELGCGTGRDAVTLARNGINVVATDVSPGMVARTRARADAEGVGHLVDTRVGTASDAAWEDGPFDGVYSNGAVLNLEPDLEKLARGLGKTIKLGGMAILTGANRIALFELALYSAILRPRKAFRKLGKEIPIPISREGAGRRYVVSTRFRTPREFAAVFRPWFAVESWRAMQVLTPPWNLVDMQERFAVAVRPLEVMEDRLASMPGIRSLGALYLMTLRRRDS
jgi:SAM-dependent methyltransferase